MTQERILRIRLVGDGSSAERAFQSVSRAGSTLGGRIRTLALGGLAIGAAALAATGVAAVRMASDFDTSIREVNTLLNLPRAQFEQLRQDTLSLSSEIGRLPSEVVPALYSAISAGVPQDNVFDFLRVANEAAIGGVTNLETAVDGLTSVVNAYGPEVLSARDASDILFTSVRLGKTTFEELSASVNQVAPLAASLGVDFAEVAAAFTTVTTTGVPTAQAMTQIRALMQSLAAPTKRVETTLRGLNIELNAQRLQQEGFLPILDEIITKTDGNAAAQRRLFGSIEALQAALILTSENGAATFTNALAEMGDASGATADAAAILDEGIGRLLERLRAQLGVVLIRIGEEILPTLVSALEAFSDWFEQNDTAIIDAIGSFGDAFQGLLSIMARLRDDPLFDVLIESVRLLGQILAEFRADEEEEVDASLVSQRQRYQDWIALREGDTAEFRRQGLAALIAANELEDDELVKFQDAFIASEYRWYLRRLIAQQTGQDDSNDALFDFLGDREDIQAASDLAIENATDRARSSQEGAERAGYTSRLSALVDYADDLRFVNDALAQSGVEGFTEINPVEFARARGRLATAQLRESNEEAARNRREAARRAEREGEDRERRRVRAEQQRQADLERVQAELLRSRERDFLPEDRALSQAERDLQAAIDALAAAPNEAARAIAQQIIDARRELLLAAQQESLRANVADLNRDEQEQRDRDEKAARELQRLDDEAKRVQAELLRSRERDFLPEDRALSQAERDLQAAIDALAAAPNEAARAIAQQIIDARRELLLAAQQDRDEKAARELQRLDDEAKREQDRKDREDDAADRREKREEERQARERERLQEEAQRAEDALLESDDRTLVQIQRRIDEARGQLATTTDKAEVDSLTRLIAALRQTLARTTAEQAAEDEDESGSDTPQDADSGPTGPTGPSTRPRASRTATPPSGAAADEFGRSGPRGARDDEIVALLREIRGLLAAREIRVVLQLDGKTVSETVLREFQRAGFRIEGAPVL